MNKYFLPGKDIKIVFYSAGFIIIISLWMILRSNELSDFNLLMSGLLIMFGYAATVFDINTKKIPNLLILSMFAGWLLLTLPVLFTDPQNGVRVLTESGAGFLTGGGLFLLVYFISSKNLGGGDVKFMAVAGLYLGLSGTVSTILYGTVIAALTGLILIVIKKIGRKDSIPLAPFLFLGVLITFFTS